MDTGVQKDDLLKSHVAGTCRRYTHCFVVVLVVDLLTKHVLILAKSEAQKLQSS